MQHFKIPNVAITYHVAQNSTEKKELAEIARLSLSDAHNSVVPVTIKGNGFAWIAATERRSCLNVFRDTSIDRSKCFLQSALYFAKKKIKLFSCNLRLIQIPH